MSARAYATTGADLGRALATGHIPPAIRARLDASAALSQRLSIRRGARELLARPLAVQLAVHRLRLPGDTARDVLASCTRAEAAARRSAGHWTYDRNRHAALRELQLALRWMRRFGEGA